jgi:dimethylamine monooxygenase subunit A
MPLPLHEVLPDEDYRFHLTLRPAEASAFFASANSAVLAERHHWLETASPHYAAVTAQGEPLLTEFESLMTAWAGIPACAGSPIERVIRLGHSLEPDFLLLDGDETAEFRLQTGAVCFPSAWALSEKIGHTLDEIHGPVPTLNHSLGPSIGRFLARIKPGTAYERANWGLAATRELNLHPSLIRPSLKAPINLREIWLRIEDQLLARLPTTLGILFGIRLRILPLAEVLGDETLRTRFVRAIETMPEAIAAYKGIAPVRQSLLTAAKLV